MAKKICRFVGKALVDFDMLHEGDRVLVAVSGGKDSLSMLHALRLIQRKCPFRFDIGAATVDPQTPEYDPSPLIDYMKQEGIPYFYLSQPLIEQAKVSMDPRAVSICAFCARMKRGMLYTCCRTNGYNVLAMGQHLDDLAESLCVLSDRCRIFVVKWLRVWVCVCESSHVT
jgi:tRNA 2-thiocytidine biosynthesis protein TtcA